MFFTGPAAVRLYDDHVDAIHRYLTRRLGPEVGIPLVGETFALAVNSEGPPNNTTEMERSWLLAIATGVLRRFDDVEQERLAEWSASSRRAETPDPLLARGGPTAKEDAVMRAAAQLQPEDRDLLFLTCWEGYPTQTSARVLGLSTGATSSALKRVRRALRRAAGDHGAETSDASDTSESETGQE